MGWKGLEVCAHRRHKVGLRKILGEEGGLDDAKLSTGTAALFEVRERAQQQLHVEVCADRAHLFDDAHQIGGTEALERTLRVIDSLEDGKQPHAHIMAHYDLHHVRLLEVGLRVARWPAFGRLHQERLSGAISSAHAHLATADEHAVCEDAAQAHVGREVLRRTRAVQRRWEECAGEGAAAVASLLSDVRAPSLCT